MKKQCANLICCAPVPHFRIATPTTSQINMAGGYSKISVFMFLKVLADPMTSFAVVRKDTLDGIDAPCLGRGCESLASFRGSKLRMCTKRFRPWTGRLDTHWRAAGRDSNNQGQVMCRHRGLWSSSGKKINTIDETVHMAERCPAKRGNMHGQGLSMV